jgi:hypothetical protein
MSKLCVIFSSRVQSQVADANLGTKGLNALFGVLNPIRVTSLELALLGDGSGADCILNMDIAIVMVRSAPTRSELTAMIAWARNAVRSSKAARVLPPTMYGVPTIDLLAAVFLYTAENPYPLYSCITSPLNVSGARTLQSLQQQLPFMKLFTLGLLGLSSAGYHFKGALYRGIDVSKSAAFKAKYDSHATAYEVGTTITFVAPTSFSTSDTAAGAFTKGIQFVVPDGDGVNLDDVSAFDEENEVVVNGPSSWEVVAATMTPTGTLVVVIKRLPDFVTFLTSSDDLYAPTPAAATPAPTASSFAVAAYVSSDPQVSVEPELQSLADALVALKIGLPKMCAAFAVSLSQEGVLSIDDLRLFSDAEARDVMHRAGLKELQQRKLMQAVAPPLSAASLPVVTASSFASTHPQLDWSVLNKDGFTSKELISSGCSHATLLTLGCDLKAAGVDAATLRANGCDWANLKSAGFTARDLRLTGGDFPTLKSAGYDPPSLKAAGFDIAAFREAQCDWTAIRTAGFTSKEAKAAGGDLPTLKSAGYDPPSLKAAFDIAAFRAVQCSWADLKKVGFTSKEAKAAGGDLRTLKSAGYDPPSLKAAGFDIAAFRAALCSWTVVKTAGFTVAEAKAAGCNFELAKSAGYDVRSLVLGFGPDAVIASGCDVSSFILVSCAATLLHALHAPSN